MLKKINWNIVLIFSGIFLVTILVLFPYEDSVAAPTINSLEDVVSANTLKCDTNNKAEDSNKLKEISCEEYNDAIKSTTNELTFIGRPTCGYCNMFVPVLEKIKKEYDIEVNYFNTDNLSKNEVEDFYSSSELYMSSDFGTPTLILTNNKEIIEYNIGYMEYDNAVAWLKKVGVINE